AYAGGPVVFWPPRPPHGGEGACARLRDRGRGYATSIGEGPARRATTLTRRDASCMIGLTGRLRALVAVVARFETIPARDVIGAQPAVVLAGLLGDARRLHAVSLLLSTPSGTGARVCAAVEQPQDTDRRHDDTKRHVNPSLQAPACSTIDVPMRPECATHSICFACHRFKLNSFPEAPSR